MLKHKCILIDEINDVWYDKNNDLLCGGNCVTDGETIGYIFPFCQPDAAVQQSDQNHSWYSSHRVKYPFP